FRILPLLHLLLTIDLGGPIGPPMKQVASTHLCAFT
ncbi:MAG: hypothetical protein ACI9OJ_003066, partial [Myxococcota bacterium]